MSHRNLGNMVDIPARIDRKLGFKDLDHAFRYVATVHVRGNKLEGCLPFLLDLQFVGGAAFVVDDLEVEEVAVLL